MNHTFTVLGLLVYRELRMFFKEFLTTITNSIIVMLFQIVMLHYFLPTMGMDQAFRVPLLLGNSLAMCFVLGFQAGMAHTADLQSSKLFAYHYALPASPFIVVVAKVLSIMLRCAALTIPIIFIGIGLLGGLNQLQVSLWIIPMFFMVLLFFALFFLLLSSYFHPEYYLDNLWPRFLGVMYTFGAVFFTWKRIYALSPKLALIFLLNPAVYCIEGMRGALLGGPEYLHPALCIAVLIFVNSILAWGVSRALVSRIDPV